MILRVLAALVAAALIVAGLAFSPWPWLAPIVLGAALGWWALTSEEDP